MPAALVLLNLKLMEWVHEVNGNEMNAWAQWVIRFLGFIPFSFTSCFLLLAAQLQNKFKVSGSESKMQPPIYNPLAIRSHFYSTPLTQNISFHFMFFIHFVLRLLACRSFACLLPFINSFQQSIKFHLSAQPTFLHSNSIHSFYQFMNEI